MQEQNRYQFLELKNQNIDRWLGLQLAMDQESIIWSHPEVPFTQYMCVDLYLRGQDPISLEAGLDDDCNWYGLRIKHNQDRIKQFKPTAGDILRTCQLSQLPVGLIDDVIVEQDTNSQCVRLTLRIADAEITFYPGEIAWQNGKPFPVIPQEFVLLKSETAKASPGSFWNPKSV